MNELRVVSLFSPFKSLMRSCIDNIAYYTALAALGLICLTWSIIAVPLYWLLPRRMAIPCGRRGIMAAFRLFSYILEFNGVFRLDLSALDALTHQGPMILAPNHPSLLDAVLILSRHPGLACVMKADLMGNIFLGPGARLARYIGNDSTRQMLREGVADLQRGGTLLLFPEGTRTTRTPINTLHKSFAVIAKHAQVPVQSVIIETDVGFLSKGWSVWRRPPVPITYRVSLGRRFEPNLDADQLTRDLEQFFRTELHGGMTAQWVGRPCH